MTTIPITDQADSNPVDTDPGGALVAVCAGTRCAALWRLRDGGVAADADPFTTDGLTQVRRAVTGSAGAVLVRLECLGACAVGPLVAVAHRTPDRVCTSEAVWIAGADEPVRHAGLLEWLDADWSSGAATAPPGLAAGLLHMAPVRHPTA